MIKPQDIIAAGIAYDNETFDQRILRLTESLLAQAAIDAINGVVDLEDPTADNYFNVPKELIECVNRTADEWNYAHDKADREKHINALKPAQTALCMVYLDNCRCIALAGLDHDSSNDDIGFYDDNPASDTYGTYVTDTNRLHAAAAKYNPMITEKGLREVLCQLRIKAPRVEPTFEPRFVPVNNGVYDYVRSELLQFDPGVVFLSKSHVNYIENAPNPIIHNAEDGTDWDVESWVKSLTDDPEVVQLLWEVLGAALRPGVSWNQALCLMSAKGNNGKGTFCELVRNLVGRKAAASVSLSKMSIDAYAATLAGKQLNVVDENDVGELSKHLAIFKSLVTGDEITVNRKYKNAITFRFRGFILFCFNDQPAIQDRSNSLYRRLLMVPMTKNFQGIERKYIKDDYLARPEVLEYVMWKVLHELPPYNELSNPKVCQEALGSYKIANDPVRQFMDEVNEKATWDLLPSKFLYDLFKAWYTANVSTKNSPLGRNKFIEQLREILPEYPMWQETQNQVTSAGRMDDPELLIAEYKVEDWINKYSGGDPVKASTVSYLKPKYQGLLRVQSKVDVAISSLGDVLAGSEKSELTDESESE